MSRLELAIWFATLLILGVWLLGSSIRAFNKHLEEKADEKVQGFKAQSSDRQAELHKEINTQERGQSPDKE